MNANSDQFPAPNCDRFGTLSPECLMRFGSGDVKPFLEVEWNQAVFGIHSSPPWRSDRMSSHHMEEDLIADLLVNSR